MLNQYVLLKKALGFAKVSNSEPCVNFVSQTDLVHDD